MNSSLQYFPLMIPFIYFKLKYLFGMFYTFILNPQKFWIWQGSEYASVTQRSEYVRIRLDKVLNIS